MAMSSSNMQKSMSGGSLTKYSKVVMVGGVTSSAGSGLLLLVVAEKESIEPETAMGMAGVGHRAKE